MPLNRNAGNILQKVLLLKNLHRAVDLPPPLLCTYPFVEFVERLISVLSMNSNFPWPFHLCRVPFGRFPRTFDSDVVYSIQYIQYHSFVLGDGGDLKYRVYLAFLLVLGKSFFFSVLSDTKTHIKLAPILGEARFQEVVHHVEGAQLLIRIFYLFRKLSFLFGFSCRCLN